MALCLKTAVRKDWHVVDLDEYVFSTEVIDALRLLTHDKKRMAYDVPFLYFCKMQAYNHVFTLMCGMMICCLCILES